MSSLRLLRAALLCGVLCVLSAVGADLTRLAVVPVNSDARTFADLLSPPFSQLTNVVLLERSDIDRVAREQQLSLEQPQSALRVGKLLGAQGVVLVEQRASDSLSIRVVATAPGIVLAHDQFTLPVSNLTAWATSYAARAERILPKLNVKEGDAVPVSIGSLHFSVPIAGGTTLEKELTTLLRLRLAIEPAVFVLERNQMEALQRENDFNAVEESFWKGAYVIDGTINRDVVSLKNLTIDARVAPPNSAPLAMRIAGQSAFLSDFIDGLVTNILAAIGKKQSSPVWQASAEAEKFFKEAQWAATWGLWEQARESADASWFLGKRTTMTAALRIQARGSLALQMRGYVGLGHDRTDKYGFYAVPSLEALPSTAQTLELFRECSQQLGQQTNGLDANWTQFGLHLLPVTARMLEPYYKNVDYRMDHDEDLRRVRALARELNEWLTTNRASVAASSESRTLTGPALPRINYFVNRVAVNSLVAAWWESGGLWFDTPAQAIRAYETLPSLPAYDTAREVMLGNRPQPPDPPIAGWTAKDQEQGRVLWLQFLNRMAGSSNLLRQADANQLIMSLSNDPSQVEKAARIFKEIRTTHRDLGARSELFPPAQIISNAHFRIKDWGVPQADVLRQLRDSAPQQIALLDPEYGYTEWKDILRTATDTNARLRVVSFPIARMKPEQLADLIPGFESAEQKFQQRDRTGRKQLVTTALRLLREQQQALGITKTSSGATLAKADERARLTVARVWRQDEQPLPPGRTFPYRWPLKDMFWKDGNLWMIAVTQDSTVQGAHQKAAVMKFNPTTLRPELIETPFEQDVPPGARIVQVGNGEIFVAGQEALWRRDAKGTWKKISVPISGTPLLWSNSVVLSGAETIVQVKLDTDEARILASKRRNPPVSALDSAHLNGAVLTVWPDNNLYTLVGKQVWRFESKQNDWRAVISVTNCGESLQLEPQGVFFRQSGECGGVRLFGGWRPNTTWFEYFAWMPPVQGSPRGVDPYTPPLWRVPDQSVSYNRVAQFDGSGIWLFPVLFNPQLRVLKLELAPPTLLFFDPTLDRGLELELDFARDLAAEAEAYKKSWPPPMFLATPDGLAIQVAEPAFLLWIPKADLQIALARAREQQGARERIDAPALGRFDKNGDGWLDDMERRSMRQDTTWQKEFSSRIEAARARALKEHGPEWEKMFANADKNQDGKLSNLEFATLVSANPSTFAERLLGSNVEPFPLARPFDLDSDAALERAEFLDFMADPRLPSEINRSGTWVTNFGLKLEECDTNGDGILDKTERAAALRLIRQKPASRK